jgi:tripartite-type tricarboxylate transporter receptor subunit TctC
MKDQNRRPDSLLATRRGVLALGVAAWATPHLAWADDYPSRPLRLMVGFSPGGGVDSSARIIAPRMGDELKGTLVVDNKAGASGMICSDYVAKSAPDGYTLMYTAGSAITVAPHLVAKPPINSLTDLMPVNGIGAAPLVLSLHPGTNIRTLAEFIAQAKTRQLTLASAGIGTLTHLTIELLAQVTGGKIVHVPYKGGGAAVVDALSGHVDGMISDIPPVLQQFQAGKLVPIAVTSEQRFDLLPNIPTANEVLKGFTAASWMGVFAPAKTPQPIIDRLSAAVARAVAREDVGAQLKKVGVLPYSYPTPDAFRKFIAEDNERWSKLIREKKITAAS